MSLLMQALRTAEKAKKKQAEEAAGEQSAASTPASAASPAAAAGAEPEALSLQPRELTPSERADAAAEAKAGAGQSSLDDVGLEPQAERTPAPAPEPAPRAPVEEPVDYFSGALRAPVEPYIPSPSAFAAPTPEPEPAPAAAQPAPAAEAPRRAPMPAPVLDNSAALEAAKARTAASALFAAKQRAQRRRPLIIAGLGLLAVGGVGLYLYLQLARVSQPPPFVPAPVASVPVDVAAGAASVPVAEPVPVAVTAPEASVPAAAGAASALVMATPVNEAKHVAPAAPVAATKVPPAPRTATARSVAPSTDLRLPAAGAAIELRRNDGSRQVSPVLSGAWQSYQSGDMTQAQSQYERVLQIEPDNRDALLGMAAIAVNRGQAQRAGSFYARALELDPADADAVAGLASLERGDPSQAESRLKKVIANAPQSGSALFALGNVYVQQGRWPEAQQAFFRAVGASPANADYAFNLAVSLDRLSQGKLALEYYRRALQLAPAGGSNLNQASVRARIGQLEAAGADAPR